MVQVSGKLWRGPRPDTLADLAKDGFKKAINLQFGIYELFTETKYERENAADFGMREYGIPCSDFFPPTPLQVKQALFLMDSSDKTYIHCRTGKDRTGFMCAVRRMVVDGWSFEDARDEMFRLGFHKFPYVLWLPELKSYEKKK